MATTTTTTTTTTPTIQLFTYASSNEYDDLEDEVDIVAIVQLYRDFLHKQGHQDMTETNLAEEPGKPRDES